MLLAHDDDDHPTTLLLIDQHTCCKCKRKAHGLCIHEVDHLPNPRLKSHFGQPAVGDSRREVCIKCYQEVVRSQQQNQLSASSATPPAHAASQHGQGPLPPRSPPKTPQSQRRPNKTQRSIVPPRIEEDIMRKESDIGHDGNLDFLLESEIPIPSPPRGGTGRDVGSALEGADLLDMFFSEMMFDQVNEMDGTTHRAPSSDSASVPPTHPTAPPPVGGQGYVPPPPPPPVAAAATSDTTGKSTAPTVASLSDGVQNKFPGYRIVKYIDTPPGGGPEAGFKAPVTPAEFKAISEYEAPHEFKQK